MAFRQFHRPRGDFQKRAALYMSSCNKLLDACRRASQPVASQAYVIDVPAKSSAGGVAAGSKPDRHRFAGIAAEIDDYLLKSSEPPFHPRGPVGKRILGEDRKSTRLNSS